jgi:hypothetical protein
MLVKNCCKTTTDALKLGGLRVYPWVMAQACQVKYKTAL